MFDYLNTGEWTGQVNCQWGDLDKIGKALDVRRR